VAVVLTIVAVSYVAVPPVARVVESLGGYNPSAYEPKDSARAEWLSRRGPLALADLSTGDLVKIALLVLVGLAWLAAVPARPAGRRSPPR
jgi:hypothetical protein